MASRYQVLIRPSAEPDARSIPNPTLRRINRRVEHLADDPRPPGCKKLGDPNIFRIRQGDYRVIYTIDDTNRIVEVLAIAHRREVYR